MHHDIEARSPLDPEAMVVVPTVRPDGQVCSEIYAVLHRARTRQALAATRPDTPVELDSWAGPTRLDGRALRRLMPWTRRLGAPSLLGVCVSLLLAASFATAWHAQARLATARADVAERADGLSASVATSRRSRMRLAAEAKSVATLNARRSTLPSTIIEVLTAILPDSAHLTALDIDGRTVTLTGHGEKPAHLLTTLRRHAMFSTARFVSPVLRIPGRAGSRFVIRLSLGAGGTTS